MLEIPQKISLFIDKLLNDYDYFMYFLANGGLVGIIGIPLIIYTLVILAIELRNG